MKLINKIKNMDKKVKAGIFYLVGNMFDKAISFLVLPVFTRILSTEEYGLVSNYLSVQVIISTFIALNLGNTVRNAYVDFKDNLDEYISTMFVTGYISSFVITLIFFAINLFLNIIQPGYLVIVCCVHAFSSFIIGTFALRYMMSEQYVKRTILLIMPNFVVTIASIIVIVYIPGNSYLQRVFIYSSIYAVIGVSLSIVQLVKSKKRFVPKYLKYALPIAIPIIFHTLSTVILSQSDRTMITALYGAAENGIYSVVYSFGMLALVLTSSAENVWIPWFTKKMIEQNKNLINRVAHTYLLVVGFLIIVVIFVSPDILVLMAGEKYKVGIALVPPIIIASFYIFMTSFFINLEYYYKKTKHIARNTIISGIVNVVLNYLLIPKYGGVAAAYTTLASYLLNYILHFYNTKKIDRELFPIGMFVIPIVLTAGGGAIYYLFMDQWIIRWSLGVAITVVVFAKYRNTLIRFIKKTN